MNQANQAYLGFRDPISSWTHYAACLSAVFATAVLVRLCRGNRPRQWAVGCFGATSILLYAASGTYHALRLPPEQLRFFQRLDHSAIYMLIAGTYTPCFFVLVPNRLRKGVLLAIIWGLAVAGILCKWLLPSIPYWITVSIYLGMGWIVLIPMVDLIRAVGVRGMRWAVLGGLAYTTGAVLDMFGWPVLLQGILGPHELFHVFVMIGTGCHFVFMVQHVVFYPVGQVDCVLPRAEGERLPGEAIIEST